MKNDAEISNAKQGQVLKAEAHRRGQNFSLRPHNQQCYEPRPKFWHQSQPDFKALMSLIETEIEIF